MRLSRHLLCQILRTPERARRLAIAEWELLVRQARRAGLLARLGLRLESSGLAGHIPQPARWHFDAVRKLAKRQQIAVRWEMQQIRQALAGVDAPLVALKGAAYVLAGLPAAAGRLFNDIDVLVPRAQLEQAEAALLLVGWNATGLTAYDERYYRRWMHEIPPLRHLKRASALDLHHAILPPTTRHSPPTAALLEHLEPVAGLPGVFVLGRLDRVLHSAAHLFHDGELPHGLRDLSDLDLLLSDPSDPDDFWPALLARAESLQLTRPLFYAVRYARHFFDTPVPASALDTLRRQAPRARLPLMDAMFRRALGPNHASCDDAFSGAARQAAYLRAHWLRMPVHLLLPHLFHKAFVSPWQERETVGAA